MAREPQGGDCATLIEPYLGYTRVRLIENYDGIWLAQVCESGLELMLYEDEFELDD